MVAFIVGNSDPSRPILTSENMPQGRHEPSASCRQQGSKCTCSTLSGQALEQGLIPGLPDDMARKCLARVPFWWHGRCKVVSKGWHSLYSAPELLSLRRAEGVSEEYLLCFDGNPSVCQGQLYSPAIGRWRRIPPTPVELHAFGLESFGVVAAGRHVFLVGGVLFDARSYPTDFPVPSRDVYRYDVVANRWERMAPMMEPRGSMALAVDVSGSEGSLSREGESGLIYVAGGDGRYTRSQRRWSHLNTAEVYDIDANEWLPLPNMNSLRAGSSGAVVDGKFAVLGGYGTPRLIGGFLQVCEQCPDSEEYNPRTDKWARRRLAWFPEDRTCTGPVCQLAGDVYMLLGAAILRLQLSCGVWCHEASLDWSDRDAAFFALNGRLHVIPSEKVSSVFQRHFTYDPVTKAWSTAKIKARLRYTRAHQACKQPFKSSAVLRL